jgi:predicted GTPase
MLLLDTEKELLEKYFEQYGLHGIDQYFTFRLRKWEQCALNIAVTGQSGAGKSSFINAIRGVTQDSEHFAPTGCTECTADPKAYPHPEHQNLIFWDLPGIVYNFYDSKVS